MKKFLKVFAIVALIVPIVAVMAACGKWSGDHVGVYVFEKAQVTIEIKDDGTFTDSDAGPGTYTLSGKKIALKYSYDDTVLKFTFNKNGDLIADQKGWDGSTIIFKKVN